MKHRILFRRIQAAVLSVAMLTSMCTTGFAAEVDSSPAESWGTAATSSLEQVGAVPAEEPADSSEKGEDLSAEDSAGKTDAPTEDSGGKTDASGTDSAGKTDTSGEGGSTGRGESGETEESPVNDTAKPEAPPMADAVKPEETSPSDTVKPEETSPSDTVKPGGTPSEDTVKPEVPPSSDTAKPEETLPSDTAKPDVPPSSDTEKPEETSPSDTVKPDVPPSSDTAKPEETSPSDTVKPEVPPSSDTVKPEETSPSDTVKPEVPPSSDTEKPEETSPSDTVKPEVPPSSDTAKPEETSPSDTTKPEETSPSDTAKPELPPSSDTAKPEETSPSDTEKPELPPLSDTVKPEETPAADSAGKPGAPDGKLPGNGVNSGTEKPSQTKDPEDPLADEFLTRFQEFLEKYQEDRRAEEEEEEPVNYKTWPKVRDAAAGLLDMAGALEDPEQMQGQVEEIKDIFISESAREFVRLTAKLVQSLAGMESSLDDEEIETVISDAYFHEFVRLVEELVQNLDNEFLDDGLAAEDEEDMLENDMPEGVYSLIDRLRLGIGEELEDESSLEEVHQDESLSDSRISEYVKNVNRLLRDAAAALYSGEEVMSGEELEERLSNSKSMAMASLEVESMLESILEEMRESGVILSDPQKDETVDDAVNEAVSVFIETLEEITENLLRGEYSVEELSADMDYATEEVFNKLLEALDTMDTGSEEWKNLEAFLNFFGSSDFRECLVDICILLKTAKVYALEDLSDFIRRQREDWESLLEGARNLTLLSGYKESVESMFSACDSALDDILASRKAGDLEARIDSIWEKLTSKSYGSLRSLEEEAESVNEFAESILSDEDEMDERFQAVRETLQSVNEQVAVLQAMEKKFQENHERFIAGNTPKPGESLNWEEFSGKVEASLEALGVLEADYQIFTAEEYRRYEEELIKILVDGAFIEFKARSESLAQGYADMAPSAILKEIDYLKMLRLAYLEELNEEEQKEAEKIEKDFINIKVSAFLAQVQKMQEAVTNGDERYSGYEGCYRFVADMEEAESLLDSEELKTLDEGKLKEIADARAALEELELEVSLSVTPETKKIWETFNDKYEELIREYENPENSSSWEWKDILPRITDLQKLADRLPAVYYNKTSDQRQKLTEILSEEAEKEVEGVIAELEDCLEEGEIRRKVNYAREVLDYVLGYSGKKEPLAKKLEDFLWKAELMGNEELSEDAKEFLAAVRAFEREIDNPENLDENGRLTEEVLSELTSSYEYLRELYRSLSDDDKALKSVKNAYENLKELWDALCGYYSIEADVLNQIYDFLEAVEDFKRYYSDHAQWEDNPLNLILAYEECVEQGSRIWKLLSENPDISQEIKGRFEAAAGYLEGLKEEIEDIESGLDDKSQGGLYIAGDPIPEGGDMSVPQKTIDNTREFIRLIQNMEGGLAEIHGILQRIKELTYLVKNGVAATPSDAAPEGSEGGAIPNRPMSEEELKSIQQEIDELLKELGRISRTTEYDNWHGLMGGEAYARTAWSTREDGSVRGDVANPMVIKIEKAVTAGNLGLGEFRVDGENALNQVENAIREISIIRSELGARQNLSERIVSAMENWLANDNSASAHKVGAADNAKERTYDDVQMDRVIGSSLDNARKLLGNIQVFEGILNESHDMLQRLSELAFRLENDTNLMDDDKASIRREMKALSEGLTFLAEYVNYDNWHGLGVDGGSRLVVPTGWYDCHVIQIPIGDMTEKGLGLDNENLTIQSVNEAIVRISDNRSILGAWQNTCEHIIELCEITLETGPLIGNKFEDYTDEDGHEHHRPLVLTDWFDRIYSDMEGRIRELEKQKANGTLTENDKRHIDQEIHELRSGVDILIDLIKTSVEVAPSVRLEGDLSENWAMNIAIEENETDYRYKLTYQSVASGTKNVCLVDHIEGGDHTVYAGVVKGVDISEAIEKGITVKVYVQTSPYEGKETAETDTLPEALKQAGGEWTLVENLDTFENWKYVTHVAFDFGDYAFGVEQETTKVGVSDVSVEILMSSIYGGKPGCEETKMPEGGYILYNTCDVYQKIGDSPEVEMTRSGLNTEVLIKYSQPVRLPSTGGGGTWPIHRAGLMFLAMGTCMLIFRRQDEEEPLF